MSEGNLSSNQNDCPCCGHDKDMGDRLRARIAELEQQLHVAIEHRQADEVAHQAEIERLSAEPNASLDKAAQALRECMESGYGVVVEMVDALRLVAIMVREGNLGTSQPPSDPDCICKGNWRAIVKECEPLIDTQFIDSRGDRFNFFGIVHGANDYYYGMSSSLIGMRLLSCVGSIEGHGYTAVTKEPSLADRQHELPPDAKGVLYSRMRELQRPADGVPLDKREHQLPAGETSGDHNG